MTSPGILELIRHHRELIAGKRIGLLINQASILPDFTHVLDALKSICKEAQCEIKAVFGPQHGLWGQTQDNMIEWEGRTDPRFPWRIHSLYGRQRHLKKEWVQDVDVLIVDLQDVGSRYYTFIWTLAHVLEDCAEWGLPVIVTDRPNPINAVICQGPLVHKHFRSFVGWHSIPIRHGMTIGEIAHLLRSLYYSDAHLTVIPMNNYMREMFFAETKLPWMWPSPNMPSMQTPLVYPGGCLLEATNLSEGRGTTRPFEILGAPWLDGQKLKRYLEQQNLPGFRFMHHGFQPTFNKYSGELCDGIFIHVSDLRRANSLTMVLFVLQYCLQEYSDKFAWKQPPYEYEFEKLPIDILLGHDRWRKLLENGERIDQIEIAWNEELEDFLKIRKDFLLY